MAYSTNNFFSGSKEYKPRKNYNYSQQGGSNPDGYQKFLEYLEHSGYAGTVRKKLLSVQMMRTTEKIAGPHRIVNRLPEEKKQ